MKTKWICLVVFVVLIPAERLYSQYRIDVWVIGSGGGTTTNAEHSVISTFGQTISGVSTGNTFQARSGFWYTATPRLMTSVEQMDDSIPNQFTLGQNYPNPFNPQTTIRYDLPVGTHVRLEVFDLMGRQVATLHNGPQSAGRHTAIFDAARLSSGMYIYRIMTPEFNQSRKLMLVK